MKNRPSLLDIEAFNQDRQKELEQEPSILEEDSDIIEAGEFGATDPEILKQIEAQKAEIDKISGELARVVEQLDTQKELLDKQQREIAELKREQESRSEVGPETQKPRRADHSENRKLILQNIVTLIEEKGFSYNDVARLFKLEGFLPPSPYATWNDRVVEKLYKTVR